MDALLFDERADLVTDSAPFLDSSLAPVELCEPHHPVERDPRHHLRVREVLRVAADLPDALVGLLPAVDDRARDAAEELPERLVDLAAVLPVDPDRVEELAEDVELELAVRAVSDPHRPRATVALEVGELDLGQEPLAADAIHDLEVLGPSGRRPLEPGHVRLGLVREPQREE